MKTYYIGADAHKQTTTLAVRHQKKVINVVTVKTQIDVLIEFLNRYRGRKLLTFEETSLSTWLYSHLHDHVDTLIVCDPRRNKLICDDGDKADPVDACDLAELLENNSLRAIHHTTNQAHLNLKQWLTLYHDRVQDKVRHHHKITALALQHGITIPDEAMDKLDPRTTWLYQLADRPLAEQLQLLWPTYDLARQQVDDAQRKIEALSRAFPIIRKWQKLPGIGPIRAITLYAHLETPWRFSSKSKLWKYCGIGLERCQSGADKKGRPNPARTRMPRRCNRILKNTCLGAAQSIACKGNNLFKREYERMVKHGTCPTNALHAIARKLLTVMWGMWKNNHAFEPALWRSQHQSD